MGCERVQECPDGREGAESTTPAGSLQRLQSHSMGQHRIDRNVQSDNWEDYEPADAAWRNRRALRIRRDELHPRQRRTSSANRGEVILLAPPKNWIRPAPG